MINLEVSGSGADRLISTLEQISGVEIHLDTCRGAPGTFDRDLRTEPVALAALIVVGLRLLPKAIDKASDIIIEHIRSNRISVIVKSPDGFEVSFTGPLGSEDEIRRLANALAKHHSAGG